MSEQEFQSIPWQYGNKVRLTNGKQYLAIIDKPISVTGLDDAARAEWWPINSLPHLAFDHDEIISDAIILIHKLLKL